MVAESVHVKPKVHSKEIRATCHALFVAGLPSHRIEAQTGVPQATVRKWAERGCWAQARDGVGQMAQKAVEVTVSHELERRSNLLQDRLSAKLVEHCDILSELKPNGIKGLMIESPIVAQIINSADKLFGWSKREGPSTLVQVNYLNELKPSETPQGVVDIPVQPDSVGHA